MNITHDFTATDRIALAPALGCLNAGLEPLAQLADQARSLEKSLDLLEQLAGETGQRSVIRLRDELAAFEPAITIVGQVKSGKTTLVNALAGWSDLLPADVNPWTSVVTSLHLMPGRQRQDVGARFQLMREEEWDRLLRKGGRLGELADRAGADTEMEKIRAQIEEMREKSRRRLGRKFELLLGQEHEYGYFDKNLLERYICLGDDFLSEEDAPEEDDQGRFADITRSADLFLHCQSMPHPLCIRDTPGVNDTFMMREQVTINAVRNSRVCVMVLSANQALTSVDMGLIRLVSNLNARDVIIFVNRIDELQDPGEQVPEIEASIRATLAEHDGPEDAQIIFGSAYWAGRVLSETVDDMTDASAAALMNWAEAQLATGDHDLGAPDMIWQLSGLPQLNRAIAEQVVDTLGAPKLRKIAAAAVTIASGQQAANLVRIAGDSGGADQPIEEIRRELASLSQEHLDDLADALAAIAASHHERSDRAHKNFLERATHSLIAHLEKHGDGPVWEYSPTGLRMLLKSAHSVFTSRAQTAAAEAYQNAVADVAELYYRAFGDAVEGIQLSVPEVPAAAPPVSLAQTIALDFNDGWWRTWWRRARGYKAFAARFHAMIAAETADFITQFKTAPTNEFTARLIDVLQSFLDQSRDVLDDIAQGNGARPESDTLFLDGHEQDRQSAIAALIADLEPLALQGREDTSTNAGQ
ncbi:dynamin family protein [Arenibacterium halophilum]|uniref:Dynamin N-terminal domain-containing protein n=1 Tax=Arenibacterium halophilum TaxID=2583821 RepID=A0ABY2X6V0_9RHOB|nr:dynamin family protein [Arenibacterium halophilum]TMV11496.1 hypothetical protein FGK64_14545 [Arenibacterium halophilum]